MNVSVTKLGEARYAVIVEEGRQEARRCRDCRKKLWTADHSTDSCPKCGGPLGKPTKERRQRWHRGFTTRKAATAARDKLIEQLTTKRYVGPSKLTLGDFLTREWLPIAERRVRPSTLDDYRRMIARHVVPQLGTIKLQDLSASDLNRMYSRLSADGKSKGKGLSPKRIRNVHNLIHRALKDARKWGHLPRNVAEDADPPAFRKREFPVWTVDQLRTFLEAIQGERLEAAFVLGASTGMRRGEILGLRPEDADLGNARLHVRQNLISVAYKVMVSEPKTERGKRLVELDEFTVAALKAHKAHQAEEKLAWGPAYQDQGYLFTREDGSWYHPDVFSDLFERILKRLDLPRIRLHDMRHTYATLSLAAGVPAEVVSRRLGHSSTAFTIDTYGHRVDSQQQEAAEKVAGLIFGHTNG